MEAEKTAAVKLPWRPVLLTVAAILIFAIWIGSDVSISLKGILIEGPKGSIETKTDEQPIGITRPLR